MNTSTSERQSLLGKQEAGDLRAGERPNKQQSLDSALVRGVAWTGASKWLSQIVAWSATLIVARILTPSDYGVVTMGTVYLGLVTLLSQFGVDAAVITMHELSERDLAELNSLSVVLGIFGLGLSFALAAPLGKLFGSAELPAVLVVMSLGFVISSFQAVPAALLQKELQFKYLSLVDAARAMVLAAATVAMAWAGLGYWSLVFGAILSAALSAALILMRRRTSFALPRPRALRNIIHFSRQVLISRLCWYGYSNADFVVAGRLLGQSALGSYTLAWNLANVPLDKITNLISTVAPSVFSAAQSDAAALRRYLLRLTEALAFITFPLTVGLALVAREFVLVLLGTKWMGAVTALELLAFYASVRSITPLLNQILMVTRETRFTMWNTVAAVILLPAAFYAGARVGIAGIAAAWMIGYPVIALPLYWKAFRKIGLSAGEYMRALGPALSGTAAMAAGVLLFRMRNRPASAALLTEEIALGALIYVGITFLFHRQRLRTYLRVFDHLRRPVAAVRNPEESVSLA